MANSNHTGKGHHRLTAGAPSLIEFKGRKFLIINNPTQSTIPNFIAVRNPSLLPPLSLSLTHTSSLPPYLTLPSSFCLSDTHLLFWSVDKTATAIIQLDNQLLAWYQLPACIIESMTLDCRISIENVYNTQIRRNCISSVDERHSISCLPVRSCVAIFKTKWLSLFSVYLWVTDVEILSVCYC